MRNTQGICHLSVLYPSTTLNVLSFTGTNTCMLDDCYMTIQITSRRPHNIILRCLQITHLISEGIWLKHWDVVKHSTADPGIASSIPLTPTKITKRRYVMVLPRRNAPVYQCFTLGTLKNLVCHVWWALQYLAL